MSTASTGNEPLIAVAPEYFVSDLSRSVRFWKDELGCRVLRQDANFAGLVFEDAHIMLATAHSDAIARWLDSGPRGVGMHVRFMAKDLDDLYRRLVNNGVPIVSAIADRPYGLRDFIIADPDGFQLGFAAPIKA